ncbi:DUF3783 domain-containing protein [Clostridioides mangenotii]|uniref:DUF3783 domain-containing protein n=1 Tax=Metaclostridioides mangenotii TaxID=1540 RepID=UPI001C100AD0|nr:DUF3783 domain-containing protein [Clostridioides mangenotii]MBU5307145.1 DUF3783 domain-containing protein [Clostridioides mangenotii]
MSFEKISSDNKNSNDSKTCIILVNFDKKELSLIRNVSRFAGIKENIVVSGKHGENTINDILSGKIEENNEKVLSSKAIIFNNIPAQKVSGFLDSLKKMRMRRPLTAMVTETSIDWTLSNLIANLIEENTALSSGKSFEHK